jgi:hypothetical protein
MEGAVRSRFKFLIYKFSRLESLDPDSIIYFVVDLMKSSSNSF